MFKKIKTKLDQLLSRKNILKYFKIFISIFFFILIINIILENIEFINLFKEIQINYIFYPFFLILIRIIFKTFQQQNLYKLAKVDFSFTESLKIYLSKIIGNIFFNFGSLYKISYLKVKHNVSLKKYFTLNTIFSIFESLFLMYLFIYLLSINKIINLKLNTLSVLFLFVTIFALFYLYYIKTTSKLSSFKNISLLLINSILFHYVNLLIYQSYFEILVLNKSFTQSTIYYLIGYFTNLISLTPGNIGYLEYVQIQAINFHSLDASEILAISTFNRGIVYLVIILLFIITKTIKK